MPYINTATSAYPVTEADIRASNPETSFPVPFMPPEPYEYVFPAPPPTYNTITQGVREIAPVLTDKGHYEQAFEVYDLDPGAAAFNKAYVQEQKWEAIKTERDWRKLNGVKVGSNWFHSDTFSRTQQIGLVMMGAAVPAIQWKTMDGTFVTMSQTLASQIFQAVANSDASLFSVAETKRAAMMAMDDPTTYDVSAGWPETHQ